MCQMSSYCNLGHIVYFKIEWQFHLNPKNLRASSESIRNSQCGQIGVVACHLAWHKHILTILIYSTTGTVCTDEYAAVWYKHSSGTNTHPVHYSGVSVDIKHPYTVYLVNLLNRTAVYLSNFQKWGTYWDHINNLIWKYWDGMNFCYRTLWLLDFYLSSLPC